MRARRLLCLVCSFGATLIAAPAQEPLRVPAFTAYVDPEPEGARVSSRSGITGWTNPANRILWFGEFKTTGRVDCALSLKLPKDAVSALRLSVSGLSREARATGAGLDNPVTADFGSFTVGETGYQSFVLEALGKIGEPFGNPEALVLTGPALTNVHFSLAPRRNGASVHLFFPAPKEPKIEAFYNEVTGKEDPTSTFYMACGFHRGYFGMQVNSKTERRIIFSVWDSGNEAVDRRKVAKEDRVELLAKGDGVYASDFGNEGTGGHSHLKYFWKTGEAQRFLVTAQPTNQTSTIYTGYYFHPEQKKWVLIARFKAPRDGGYLRGLHSFSENFWGSNGHLRRYALFGNQWIKTADNQWTELLTASFSHDGHGKKDRLDRFMGVEGNRFFLSSGGFIAGFTKYGEKFTRPTAGRRPTDLEPSNLPAQ